MRAILRNMTLLRFYPRDPQESRRNGQALSCQSVSIVVSDYFGSAINENLRSRHAHGSIATPVETWSPPCFFGSMGRRPPEAVVHYTSCFALLAMRFAGG